MNKNYPKRVSINGINPEMRWIKRAVEILREGGIIVYPTDSNYGLGCDIFQKKGMERIYRLKKIDRHHPLSLIFPDLKNMSRYVHISNRSHKILKRCLPGPYTFILEATLEIPKIMLAKRRKVGIRIPDNVIVQTLVATLNNPILNTSVGSETDEFMNNPEVIEKTVGHAVDLILDGGIIISQPSTIFDLTEDDPVLIREGKGDPALVY